jgi:hypothetical protein
MRVLFSKQTLLGLERAFEKRLSLTIAALVKIEKR